MKTKLHLIIAFIITFVGHAQTIIGSYPAVDGGFENQTAGNLTNATLLTNAWTTNTNGAGNLRTITASGGRTGPQYVTFGLNGSSTSIVTKYYYSSQLPGAFAANTKYQIQFYCRATSGSTTTNVNMYVDNSTTAFPGATSRQGVSAALGTAAITDWTKKTYEITTNATTPLTNGLVGFSITPIASTAYSVDIDDYVIYQGEIDSDKPNSPGAITATGVTAGANVIWDAASGGVDGGGYVVVRYATTAPSASDDPIQNGIYAKGNAIIGAGVVRYIGTATSFADTGLSPGVDYYYKVYTVDKAFNYSNESTSAAVQSLATTYYYNGTGLLTDLASWGQNPLGNGIAPTDFTAASQVFEIRNTTAVALDGLWTVGTSNGTKVRLGNTAGITLTLNSGASIGPSGSGNFDVFDPPGNHTVIYKGTTLVSFGNIFDANFEVVYDGVTVSTTTTKSFGTVTIKNGADVSFSAAVTINNLSVESGSFGRCLNNNPIITSIAVDATSTLETPTNASNYITIPSGGSVVINGTVKVPKLTGFVSSNVVPSSTGGDIQFIGTENLTLGANSTVEYIRDATSNQNITARTDYKNLTLSGTVPKTINGPTTVAGTLTINQSAPATAVTLGGDLTVNGNLTFTLGKITTGSNTLTIGTSGTITGADQATGWVVGNLKKATASSASPSYTYPIGDATNYTPLILTFSGVTSVAGGLTAGINTGDYAQIATSGLDGTKSVNKNWTLTNDALAGFGTYSAAFTYTNADIDGISTPANYLVKLYNGATWSSITTSGTPTNTATAATGISGFGDFAIGELDPSLGLSDYKSTSYTLFPNPVNDGVLYISSDNSSDKSIEIYDLLGKKVFSSGTISDKVEIKSLKNGVYFARIKTEKQATVQKIIINNN